MKTLEYQAKDLFSEYGIPVEKYVLCDSLEQVAEAYNKLAMPKVVIKAQVLSGGRGKAGGVKLANTKAEAELYAKEIFALKIKELPVKKIILSEAVNIATEYYISFTIDRNKKSVILIMSTQGGIDIEKVAEETPDKIHRFHIDQLVGIPNFMAREFAFKFFDKIELVSPMANLIQNLYNLFVEKDASLAEINPLVLTKEGTLCAIDAKMTIDDNAEFRQSKAFSLFAPSEDEKMELFAKSKGFSYVGLDGNIGCMVNGAGLAMATMDLIKLYGGNPANFLDIGGSSNSQKTMDAMQLLLSHPKVKAVLINIFGGITRCDDVARGLLEAFDNIETEIPIVVRLTGTNEKEGRKLLEGSKVLVAETMTDAVKLAVSSIK